MLTREDLQAIAQMLEPIKEGMDRLEERAMRTEDRITGIEEKVTSIEQRMDRAETRLTKLEINMEHQIDKAIKLLGEGHESLRQMIEGRLVTKEQQEESDTRVFALEEISKQHTAQIEELQRKTS